MFFDVVRWQEDKYRKDERGYIKGNIVRCTEKSEIWKGNVEKGWTIATSFKIAMSEHKLWRKQSCGQLRLSARFPLDLVEKIKWDAPYKVWTEIKTT